VRSRRISKLGLMMVVVAMIAGLLAVDRATRRRRNLEDAAWFAAKAVEARAAADAQEKAGNPIAAKAFRDSADQCKRQCERQRAAWW
jgi:hypothetical protein